MVVPCGGQPCAGVSGLVGTGHGLASGCAPSQLERGCMPGRLLTACRSAVLDRGPWGCRGLWLVFGLLLRSSRWGCLVTGCSLARLCRSFALCRLYSRQAASLLCSSACFLVFFTMVNTRKRQSSQPVQPSVCSLLELGVGCRVRGLVARTRPPRRMSLRRLPRGRRRPSLSSQVSRQKLSRWSHPSLQSALVRGRRPNFRRLQSQLQGPTWRRLSL